MPARSRQDARGAAFPRPSNPRQLQSARSRRAQDTRRRAGCRFVRARARRIPARASAARETRAQLHDGIQEAAVLHRLFAQKLQALAVEPAAQHISCALGLQNKRQASRARQLHADKIRTIRSPPMPASTAQSISSGAIFFQPVGQAKLHRAFRAELPGVAPCVFAVLCAGRRR